MALDPDDPRPPHEAATEDFLDHFKIERKARPRLTTQEQLDSYVRFDSLPPILSGDGDFVLDGSGSFGDQSDPYWLEVEAGTGLRVADCSAQILARGGVRASGHGVAVYAFNTADVTADGMASVRTFGSSFARVVHAIGVADETSTVESVGRSEVMLLRRAKAEAADNSIVTACEQSEVTVGRSHDTELALQMKREVDFDPITVRAFDEATVRITASSSPCALLLYDEGVIVEVGNVAVSWWQATWEITERRLRRAPEDAAVLARLRDLRMRHDENFRYAEEAVAWKPIIHRPSRPTALGQ